METSCRRAYGSHSPRAGIREPVTTPSTREPVTTPNNVPARPAASSFVSLIGCVDPSRPLVVHDTDLARTIL